MTNRRYMVVEHPRDEADIQFTGTKILGRIPIHHLLTHYHWMRLDETHVILVGDYNIDKTTELQDHKKVTVLPHMNSAKKLKLHCALGQKEHHFHALSAAMNLHAESEMSHFLDNVDMFGPAFTPQK